MEFALILLAVLSVVLIVIVLVLVGILLKRKPQNNDEIFLERLDKLCMMSERILSVDERQEQVQAIAVQVQRERLEEVNQSIYNLNQNIQQRIDYLRESVSRSIDNMSKNNENQLEKMRDVVDEKLTKTLETKLMQSYAVINEQLEAVHKGLGEMQSFAKDTRDLKNVLTNVKNRGTWGEIQLDNILEQMLNTTQYVRNFAVNDNSNERVDFAIKFPAKESGEVYLPIDAKFPMEEFQRIITASENADKEALLKAIKGLEQRVKDEAKSISEKYIIPPKTTDFAIMYVPLESLYAEILKIDGLFDTLQNKFRVMICGPTTIGALLNSLQMGFKTIQIENRSKELWRLLSAFKNEFLRFTDVLVKTQKKITEAGSTIEIMAKKTERINRSLENVDSYLLEEN